MKQCNQNSIHILDNPDIYRKLIDNINDVIFLLDMSGNFIYINKIIERISGYSVEKITGIHFSFFVCEEDLPGLVESYNDTLAGKLKPYEFCCKTKSGEKRYCRTSSKPLVINNQNVGLIGIMFDITEKKIMEKSLHDSDQRYRLITENMTEIILLMDLDFKIEYITPSVEKIRGFTVQEIIDLPFEKHFTKESWGRVSREIALISEQISSGNSSYSNSIDVEYINRDGSTVWREVAVKLLFDNEGKATGFLCSSRDVSEIKKSYFSLHKSQELYRLITDHIDEVIWLMDTDLNIYYVSPSVEKIRGFTPDELIKMDIYEHFAPESHKTVQDIIRTDLKEEFFNNDKKEVMGPYNLQMTCKNNEYKWHELIISVVRNKENGEITLLGVAREITEKRKIEQALKTSEEKFAKAFRYSPNIQALTRLNDNVIVEISDTIVERTGYLKEDVIGKTTIDLNCWVSDEDRTDVWWLLINTGVVKNKDTKMRDKNGVIYNVLFSAETIYIDQELYIVSTIFNLTEVRKLENMIIELSEKEKTRIAHELDSGLVNFLSSISLLCKELKRRLDVRFVEEAYLAYDISNLLDKAVSQTKAISSGLNPFLLGAESFIELLDSLTFSISNVSGINCTFSKSNSIPEINSTITRNILLIAKEVINSAIRLRKPSNIIIIADYENEKFSLIVRDDGISTVDIKNDVSYIVVKHIAGLINATMEFDMVDGSNSFVCVITPGESCNNSLNKDGRGIIIDQSAKKKILVVDEQPLVRRGLIKMLEETGNFEICGEADNYSNMIKAVRKLKPDLLICDFFLNDFHIIDLCKSISSIDPALPVLILTNQDELIYAERLIRSGASGYLMKGDPEKTIIEAVHTVLNGRVHVSKSFSVNIASQVRSNDYSQKDTIANILSERELEVFTLIGRSYSSKEISSELFLSLKAVEAIRRKLRVKLKIEDSKGLIRLARNWTNSSVNESVFQ